MQLIKTSQSTTPNGIEWAIELHQWWVNALRIHDTSGDNKLDGLELLAAITHGLDDDYDKIEELDIDDERKQWKRKVLTNKAWSESRHNQS